MRLFKNLTKNIVKTVEKCETQEEAVKKLKAIDNKLDQNIEAYKKELKERSIRQEKLSELRKKLNEEYKNEMSSKRSYLKLKAELESGLLNPQHIEQTKKSMEYYKQVIPYDEALRNKEITYKEYKVKIEELRKK